MSLRQHREYIIMSLLHKVKRNRPSGRLTNGQDRTTWTWDELAEFEHDQLSTQTPWGGDTVSCRFVIPCQPEQPKSAPFAFLPKPGILDGYWVKLLMVRGFCHLPSGYRDKPLNFCLLSKIVHVMQP